MKQLLALALCLFAALAGTSTVRAQDLYAHDWTGLYAGIYAGPGVVATSGDAGIELSNVTGMLGGIAAGYQLQVGNFVFGIDGDIGLTNVTGLFSGDDATAGTVHLDALGSLRARAGFSFAQVQLYGTAGLGAGHLTDDAAADTQSGWQLGWTAGAGIAYAITDGISVDAHYLHTALGPGALATGGPEYSATADTIAAGINFRF
jgi:outer membrane immunogenic protein